MVDVRKRCGASFDTLGYHGAGVLASMIERYWFDLGFPMVQAWRFELEGFEGVYVVRSNLVGGLPPQDASPYV